MSANLDAIAQKIPYMCHVAGTIGVIREEKSNL